MTTLMHAAGWTLLVWIIAFAVYGFALATAEEGTDD